MTEMQHPGLAARDARRRGDVGVLVSYLTSTDRIARLAAAQELGELRSREGLPHLIRCLRAADDGLKISALKAIGKIGDLGAASQVHELATSDEEPFGVRSTAAETLGRLGDRRGVTILAELLRAPDNPYPHSYRKWMIKQLVSLEGTEAIPILEVAGRTEGFRGRIQLRVAIRRLGRLLR